MIPEARIREIIAGACGTREALEPGLDLVERGWMDSLALITLLEELEDLGVEIQPTRVPGDAFRTVEGIVALCRAAEGDAGPSLSQTYPAKLDLEHT